MAPTRVLDFRLATGMAVPRSTLVAHAAASGVVLPLRAASPEAQMHRHPGRIPGRGVFVRWVPCRCVDRGQALRLLSRHVCREPHGVEVAVRTLASGGPLHEGLARICYK